MTEIRKVSEKKVGRPPRMRPADEVELRYVCASCGKKYQRQKGNFAASQSNLFAGNGHYLTWCNTCLKKLYEHYCLNMSEDEALERVCMKCDIYINPEIMESSKKAAPTSSRLQRCIRVAGLSQNKGKTYDDTLAERSDLIIDGVEDVKNNTTRVSQRMVSFWGTGYAESDYLALDNEYKDWTSRHECVTKAQEALFKSISMAQLTVNKAYQSGDTKKIKEASDTLQSLMASANVKPNQRNDNALAENNTFGTLIKKWETTRPISEPDEEWRDVDGIGHYFRVWVLGTILEMFHMKNPYKEEYEQEIERYTAHKPEYKDEGSEGSDSIRQRIFGAEDSAGGL